jgi:hypothetical protein
MIMIISVSVHNHQNAMQGNGLGMKYYAIPVTDGCIKDFKRAGVGAMVFILVSSDYDTE